VAGLPEVSAVNGCDRLATKNNLSESAGNLRVCRTFSPRFWG
jgi:hypothetical protein